MLDLIQRVESAKWVDRELDRLIFATFRPEVFENDAEAAQYADPKYIGNSADRYYLSMIGLPAYTASLDAVMTLLPEGWSVGLGDLRGRDPIVWRAHLRDHNDPSPSTRQWVEGHAATPALALLSAILKTKGDV